MLFVAGAAIYRLALCRLKGELRLAAAVIAYGVIICTLGAFLSGVLLCHAAFAASLGLVRIAFFLVECLLAGTENKFLAAFNAHKRLIRKFGLAFDSGFFRTDLYFFLVHGSLRV